MATVTIKERNIEGF